MPTITHFLGGFYLSWSLFELTLEMLCKRELGITDKQTHIVFSSLTFSAKRDIAVSLMRDSDDTNRDAIIAAIHRVPEIAKRNHLTHSLIMTNDNFTKFNFVKREISNGLKAKKLNFNLAEMKTHYDELADAAIALDVLCGFTEAERTAYGNVAKTAV
jgi:hypothetical protein